MSELWTVALFFRPHGRRHNLIFRDKERALKVYLEEFPIDERGMVAEDDYGCQLAIFPDGPLEMVMLVEEERAAGAAVELALIQARTQAKANLEAQRDPQLKFLSGAMPGMQGNLGMGFPR